MREVEEITKIPYNKISYWVKFNIINFNRNSKNNRPEFSSIQIEELQKYNLENKSPDQKRKETNIIKYGVENVFQNKDIKDKIKKTNIERFGVDHPLKSEEIKEKIKATNLERYGCEHVFQNKETKEKIYSSNIEKYGCKSPMQNDQIKERMIKNFSNSINNDEKGFYKLINLLRNNKDFWKDLKTCNLTNIAEKYNLNYNSLATRLGKDEFRKKYNEYYSFPRMQKQKELFNTILSLGEDASFNERKEIKNLELDIFVKDKKIAIEFNGSLWHSEYILDPNKAKNKHHNKYLECLKNGIVLINIFEKQWDERKNQILNFIKSKLKINKNIIGARECVVSEEKCKDFFNDNHIQGYSKRAVKSFSLIYNGEVVGGILASSHHRENDKTKIVLSRLCFKDDFTIIGGSERLFEYFKKWSKINGYKEIVSWSDNSLTDGEIYKRLKFNLKKESKPDYFFWDFSKNKYVSKQSLKNVLKNRPSGLSLREFEKQLNYYRIWDCGKKTWTFSL